MKAVPQIDNNLSKDALRIIERVVANVSGFRYLTGKKVLRPFGICIHYNFIRTASLNWCKLFGTDNEENHWKKIISEDFHHEFCQKLYSNLNITLEEFDEIRKKLKIFVILTYLIKKIIPAISQTLLRH